MFVLLEIQVYKGLWAQSPELGMGFLGNGGERRPQLCLTEGCVCLRGKHQVEVQKQRAWGVWAMGAWSDILHLDDCGVGVHQGPSLLAHGSFPSGAGVMECIYPPLETQYNTIQ